VPSAIERDKVKTQISKLLLLTLVIVLFIGCVPIRQSVPSGRGVARDSSSTTKTPTQFENPNDFKNLGPDAWKDEMEGIASWYGADFEGRLTSNGEIYDMYAFTAAHKTLPLGTVVKVDNLDNGKSVEVRINDRGPYVVGRIIDLTKADAEAIDMMKLGTAHVRLEIVKWPENSK
jgi:rare lipoprotein A (peptidoglycan hydrolase)